MDVKPEQGVWFVNPSPQNNIFRASETHTARKESVNGCTLKLIEYSYFEELMQKYHELQMKQKERP